MSQDPYPPVPPPYPGPGYAPGLAEEKVAQHIRVLGICSWVYAGLQALFILFGVVYIGLGAFILSNPQSPSLSGMGGGGPNPPPPEAIGWLFIGIGVFIALLAATLSILTMLSARDLMRHRRRTFCIVVGAIHCLNIPLGAILGVFTLIILNKPEAKALFERSSA